VDFDATLHEVEQLHKVSTCLDGLAEQYPPASEALLTIAGSVRNAAYFVGGAGCDKGP
jgi:hypothetical protein